MKPRISLRVNGTRIGDAARPVADAVVVTTPPRLPIKRVNAALSTRPNDYMPDTDDEVAS